MTLKKALTPKDTEEIKPGLFVQKGKDSYRVVNPICWNDEWRIKKQFSWKNLIWVIIILFLAWSYTHDVKVYQEFYQNVTTNPIGFCTHVDLNKIQTMQNGKGELNIPSDFESGNQ